MNANFGVTIGKEDSMPAKPQTKSTGTLLAAALAAAPLSFATASDATYLEIAVYSVADSASFEAERERAMKRAAERFDGLLWWRPLTGEAEARVDILAWESSEQAKAAAAAIGKDAGFKPFVSAIAKVDFFAHYWAAADAENLNQAIGSAPMVELALYTARDPAAHALIQKEVHDELFCSGAALGGARLVADSDSGAGFGDLLLWRDVRTWEETGKRMMATPEYATFFEGLAETQVFALYQNAEN